MDVANAGNIQQTFQEISKTVGKLHLGLPEHPCLGKSTKDGDDNLKALSREGRLFTNLTPHRKAMRESSSCSTLLPTADVLAKKLFKIVETKGQSTNTNLPSIRLLWII